MTDSILPRRGDTSLLIVDVQGALCAAIGPAGDAVVERTGVLVEVAECLGWPVAYTEQNPTKLGGTRALLKSRLDQIGAPCVAKLEFSCVRNPEFARDILPGVRSHVVVAGVETHVCVLQTVADLQARGHQCFVPEDAVASRSAANWANGLRLCERAGAVVVNVESVLFHALQRAGTPEFRRLAPLIR